MSSEVLGIRYDALTMAEAVDRALALMAQRRGAYVCTPNPEIVWQCRKDDALREAIAGADMTLADGVGIVWAAGVLGAPVPERVTGYDFLLALLGRMKGSVYLLGGKPGVAEDAAANMERQLPRVRVCGCRDGYFDDNADVLADIRAASPDLLMVCMGSPKQEIWMAENREALNVGLMAGLGGCLDVLSGRLKRAPQAWIRLRLEWLYRLAQQPRRIGRQMRLPLFVLAVLAEKIKKGRGSEEPQG